MGAAAPIVLHLSLVVGGELRDAAGERLGRVDDLIVRLGDDDYPPVAGVVATVAGRQVFVAAEQIVEHRNGRVLDAVAALTVFATGALSLVLVGLTLSGRA